MRLILYIFLSLFLISSVNAIPHFISVDSNDEDVIYGDNDRPINFTVRMNNNNYLVYADFSNIESLSNGTQKVINNNDGSYTINYIILNSAIDGTYAIDIYAFDPSDGSNAQTNFNVSLDNTNPIISNPNKYPWIAFNTDNIKLNSTASDNYGLKNILINGNWEGVFKNYSSLTNISNVYSFVVNSSYLENGEILKWKYIAIDKANNYREGSLITSRLNNRTNISLLPAIPDGRNNWYKTEPVITLNGDLNTSTLYYRFDNEAYKIYLTPFLRSNLIVGINDLVYFTNFTNGVSNRTEDAQEIILYIDTKKPIIGNLNPLNNSITGPDLSVSAVVDDVYFANSGIDLGSVRLFLDSGLISAQVSEINNLKASVSTTVNNLGNGEHNITVNAMDKAGNNESMTWFFNVDISNITLINLFSPENKAYDKRNVLVNLTISEKAKQLWIKDNDKLNLLCTNCNKYSKFLNFNDGEHNIRIIASDNASNNISKDINLFIDTVKPVITKINFKNKTVTNSTFFDARYNEKYLETVKFYYKENTSSTFTNTILNCKNGTNMHCNLSLNKAGLDGKSIIYYFEVNDKVRSVFSKKQEVRFDFSGPSINILDPRNSSYNTRQIRLDLSSNEKLKSVSYKDNNLRVIPLCSNCFGYNKTITLINGTHNLEIKAVDLVGNSNMFIKTFTIV